MNEWERLNRQAERYKEMYPPGTRLELISMDDPYAPVPPGTRGTVQYVDDASQIGMKWDDGRTLSLIPGEDSFRKLTTEELAEEQNENMNNEDTAPVIASRTLRRNGMTDQATEMCDRIAQTAGSYYEALNIIGEYVNITSAEDADIDEDQGMVM